MDDVRKLLGLLGYYQKYIQDFSRIAQPLFELLLRSVLKDTQRKIEQHCESKGTACSER